MLESEGFLCGGLPRTAVIVSTSVCAQDDDCLFFNLPKKFQNGVLEVTNLAVKVNYNSIKVFAYLSLVFPVVKDPSQNSIHEEIKSRLKSGNACYHSVQYLLSSSFLSKNVEIKICLLFCMGVSLGHTHWGRNVG